jgi:hypothetical protein
MSDIRDNAGRFRPGAGSPNPKGRPKKAHGVDAAMISALSEKVVVTEHGRRRRRTKLDVMATQIANKAAGGDLRAATMGIDQARKAEQRAEAETVRAPIMTEADRAIAGRVLERWKQILAAGGDS